MFSFFHFPHNDNRWCEVTARAWRPHPSIRSGRNLSGWPNLVSWAENMDVMLHRKLHRSRRRLLCMKVSTVMGGANVSKPDRANPNKDVYGKALEVTLKKGIQGMVDKLSMSTRFHSALLQFSVRFNHAEYSFITDMSCSVLPLWYWLSYKGSTGPNRSHCCLSHSGEIVLLFFRVSSCPSLWHKLEVNTTKSQNLHTKPPFVGTAGKTRKTTSLQSPAQHRWDDFDKNPAIEFHRAMSQSAPPWARNNNLSGRHTNSMWVRKHASTKTITVLLWLSTNKQSRTFAFINVRQAECWENLLVH